MLTKSPSILDTGSSAALCLRAAKRAMILTQFQTSIAGQGYSKVEYNKIYEHTVETSFFFATHNSNAPSSSSF